MAERRPAFADADVTRNEKRLLQWDVNLRPFRELQRQDLFGDNFLPIPRLIQHAGLQPPVAGEAVLQVDHEIALGEFGEINGVALLGQRASRATDTRRFTRARVGVGEEFARGRHRDVLRGINESIVAVGPPEMHSGVIGVFFTDKMPEMFDLRIFFAQHQQAIIFLAPFFDLVVYAAFG